jgi:hypothetical protein
MPSKRRPQARRTKLPRAITKTRSTAIVPLSRLPRRSSEARENALHVLAAMRRDRKLSLSNAARLEGVTVSTVKHYFLSALEKVDGRWHVSKSDRFREVMYVPDAHGNPIPVPTKNYRERGEVSAFIRDLGRFFRGDQSALAKWYGKRIAGVELVTATSTLKSIEAQLSDFAIYSTFNGGVE